MGTTFPRSVDRLERALDQRKPIIGPVTLKMDESLNPLIRLREPGSPQWVEARANQRGRPGIDGAAWPPP